MRSGNGLDLDKIAMINQILDTPDDTGFEAVLGGESSET
jgi:hypothetical protein